MASETSIIKEGKVVLYPGSPQEIAFDPAELDKLEIRAALVAIAVQRTFREVTAGRTETEEDRNKAKVRCMTRFAGWKNGEMELPRGEAVRLTDAETADAVFSYVLALKRTKGDKRAEIALRKAWNELGAEKRAEVEKKHAKGIKKVLAARLKAKRKPGADIEI